MTSPIILTVQEWHHALNNGDKEKLSVLVKEDVKMSGPRGSVKGVDALLEWVDHARVTFVPQRYFLQNKVVVVEALGEWHAAGSGEVSGQQRVTTVFTVEDPLIAEIERYDSLQEAFEKTALNLQHEIKV